MANFDVDDIVQALQQVRRQWREGQQRLLEPGGRDLPSREALAGTLAHLTPRLLLPGLLLPA